MQGFVEAIRSLNKYPLYFLDTTMGNVCQVESRNAVVGMVNKIGKGRRYIPIAQFRENGYKSLMGQFIKSRVSSKVFAKSLKSILQKKGWKAVLKAFESDEGEVEWFLAWDQFTYEEALDFAGYQLSGICEQEFKEVTGCENCPICQLMREDGGLS